MASSVVPANTPFNYNLGIDYETWESGRTGRSITADLDQITQYFKLIRTYHDAAVGVPPGSAPVIDPTEAQAISYVVAHPGVELVMGTNNNAVASGGFGTPWTQGLMDSPTYTDQWVAMVIQAFGGVANVKSSLSLIQLGNELDSNGPPPSDPAFSSYQGWINTAFENLKASLAKAGLASIPISTTIANYPVSDPAANPIAYNTTQYIAQHWSTATWNGGSPIIFFNQYTQAGPLGPASSTDYQPVINFFNNINTSLNGSAETFIGETGYSTTYTQANQVLVYEQIFAWLNGQYGQGHKTVPLFPFEAFDVPAAPGEQAMYGIFTQDSNFLPTGLKPGIVPPPWSATPINATFGTAGDDVLYGATPNASFVPGPGNDIVVGTSGVNTAIYWNPSHNYAVTLVAGHQDFVIHDNIGADGTDSIFNVTHLQFSDQTLDMSLLAEAASLPGVQFASLVELYGAYFNRAPDALGLDYWASRMADGMTLTEITKSFFAQPETAVALPSGTSTEDFVTQVYSTALGRAPDQAGFNYWVNALQKGDVTRDTFVLAIINGAKAPSGDLVDAQYLANKEAVGAHFAIDQGLGDVNWAKQVMAIVDATAQSVTSANQMTDTFVVQATTTDPHLLVPLVGVHIDTGQS
jgi:hypothetical protein